MTLKNHLKSKRAQTTIEYFVLLVVIALAIITTGFFSNARQAFETHFAQIRGQILN